MHTSKVKVFLVEKCTSVGSIKEVTDEDADKVIELCMTTPYTIDQIANVYAYVSKYTKLVLEIAILTQVNPINLAAIVQRELIQKEI